MQAGLGNLADSMQTGAGRMLGDIGGMMPHMVPPQMHPFIQARHGMIGHEMSFMGSLGAVLGGNPFGMMGVPESTSAYRYQELAARDLGDRLGTGTAMAGFYGTAAASTFALGTAGASAGFSVGTGMFDRWSQVQGSRLGTTARMARGGLGLAGGALGLAPVFAAEAMVGAIGEDIGHRQQLGNFLEASSFRYATGAGQDIDSHFGAGFNPQARARITGDMMATARADKSVSFDDLHSILQSGTEMGMFRGAQDAEDFSQKFKDLTNTVKTVTRTLHQTLEEGMRTIRELKDQGFDTPEQMRHAVSTADILGTASGRTAAEMLSVGRQGAEMVRGTGIDMGVGSQMMQRTMSFVDQMHQSGILSEEQVRQAGGAGQLAQSMMGQSINFMQSRVGRGMMMGMTGPGGQFDPGAFNNFTGGSMDLMDVARSAMRSTPTSGDYIGQVINREANMRALSEQHGGMGIQMAQLGGFMAEGSTIAKMHGVSSREGVEFAMIQGGLNETQRAALFGMMENVDQFAATQSQAISVNAREQAGEMVRGYRERPGFLRRNIGGAVGAIAGDVHGASTALGGAITGVGRSIRQTRDELFYGAPRVVDDLQAISRQDAMRIMSTPGHAGGGRITDMLSRDVFTQDDVDAFAETEAFDEIVSGFNDFTSSDALSARNLEDYAQAVAGKSFAELSREERMALSQRARKGNRHVSKAFDDRFTTSAKAIRTQRNIRINASQADIKEAEGALTDARAEAINRLGGKSFAGDRLRAFFRLDSEAEGMFDDILAGKGDKQAFLARMNTHDSRRVREAAPMVADALAEADLSDLGEGVSAAQAILSSKEDQLAREVMVSSVEERLGRTQGNRKYRRGRDTLLKIMRGESTQFSEEELSDFAKAAAQSGEAELAQRMAQAAGIGDEGIGYEAAARLIPITEEKFRQYYGDSMSREQFATLAATELADRSGGPRILGGRGGREQIQEEIEFATSLTKATSDMTAILARLEAMTERLNMKE